MIGIIGAMKVEVEGLVARLEGPSVRMVSGMRFHAGRLCGREVVVVQCGVGKVNAAMCAQTLILLYRPDLVINVGVAGCLTDSLGIGDVAVASSLVQYDVDTSALCDPIGMVSTVNRIDFPCSPRAVHAILNAAASLRDLKCRAVRIASGDRFNDDPQTTKLILEVFHAEVCEMEGCPIAQVCYINGTDCAVIRAISDSTQGVHNAEYGRYRDLAAANASRVLLAFLDAAAQRGGP